MRLTARIASGFLLPTGCLLTAAATYQIDPAHSVAQFRVTHMMVTTVTGEFTNLTGTIACEPEDLKSCRVEAAIDASTVNTHQAKRDAHLRSADFFDTAKYPTIRFVSKSFRSEAGQIRIAGDLTMHGVTREVVLKVSGPLTPAGATATTTISRKQWGLTWNRILEGGGLTVSDEVQVTLIIRTSAAATSPGKGTSCSLCPHSGHNPDGSCEPATLSTSLAIGSAIAGTSSST